MAPRNPTPTTDEELIAALRDGLALPPDADDSTVLRALAARWRQDKLVGLPSMINDEHVLRLRGKVYAALLDEKPIRTLFGRRWLDAPEAERLAAVAVAAILGAA